MELQFVHEHLSYMSLRREIESPSANRGVMSKLRILADMLRIGYSLRSLNHELKWSRRNLPKLLLRLRRIAGESKLPGAEDVSVDAIEMLRNLANRDREVIDRLNELISKARKVRNRFRYRRQPLFYWLANKYLRLYIQIHDTHVGDRRELVILLSELDPPTKSHASVPELMESLVKAV